MSFHPHYHDLISLLKVEVHRNGVHKSGQIFHHKLNLVNRLSISSNLSGHVSIHSILRTQIKSIDWKLVQVFYINNSRSTLKLSQIIHGAATEALDLSWLRTWIPCISSLLLFYECQVCFDGDSNSIWKLLARDGIQTGTHRKRPRFIGRYIKLQGRPALSWNSKSLA